MAINIKTKINSILRSHPEGVIWLASWLEKSGISRSLQEHYRKASWFEAIGFGAYKRAGQKITWESGVYALQKQACLPIHIGARTALAMHGLAHYVRTKETIFVFSRKRKVIIPKWFRKYEWGVELQYCNTLFLPDKLGLIEHDTNKFFIQISSPERAFLECLYLAPKCIDLVECYNIMQGLMTLRPQIMQELLEQCTSIKVKRIFLYMAEKARHQWFPDIEKNQIDLGTGKRKLVKSGVYVPDYQITISQELRDL